jgi:ceramide glucosyltransferase
MRHGWRMASMNGFTIAYLSLSALALLPALLLTMQTWEFRRFVRGRVDNPRRDRPILRVALFAPCKGLDKQLAENLRPLFTQDYPYYELVLIVESGDDPACGPITALMAEYPHVRTRLIVAGLATNSGQKVHNLLVATASLGEVDCLAFVDSDARPKPDWLQHLVQHLPREHNAAATGYRWFVPIRTTLPNLMLHSLNASVAALVGPGKHHMLWGGAWAIRRDVFETIHLRDAWRGTLSDDLVAARELAHHNRHLQFEPSCITASPVDVNWRQMLEFVRRQYTVARFYSPTWWLLALVCCTVSQFVFWGSLLAAIIGVTRQATWTWIPAVTVAAMYATYVARAAIRQNAADRFLPERKRELQAARLFDICFSPLAGIVNWLGLVGSLVGNRITWRSITYSIARGGQVCILDRPTKTGGNEVISTTPLSRQKAA